MVIADCKDYCPCGNTVCFEILKVSRNVLRDAINLMEIIGADSSKPDAGMVVNSFNTNFLSSCMFLNLIGDNKELVEQSQERRQVI